MTTSTVGPQPGEQWRGLHLLIYGNPDLDALVLQVPALARMGINVLVTEINYNYAFQSHPGLRGPTPATEDRVRELVSRCRDHGIRLIPQFQCLGHQSWAETTFPLLIQYPQFDETPGQFANNEGIYCRSWCPQHPEVNPLVFDLMDELLAVFQADALHVGMDEVFLIASEHCPRCRGHDPAALFAQAVRDYYGHLVEKRGVEMLMWGDRLLDDAATGYGEWEADRIGIHPAIDMIPHEIIICDWHYELRETYPSVPLFLQKGFRVWPGGWREVEAVEALIEYAQQHHEEGMLGYLCTTWSGAKQFNLAEWPPIQRAMQKLGRG